MKQFLLFSVLILSSNISFGQTKIEKLITGWPEEYKWKIIANKLDTVIHLEFTEIVPDDESAAKWTILGYMGVSRNLIAPNLDKVIRVFTNAALKESAKAKVTVLERDDTTKNFWAIYKIETPDYPNDPTPESQLTYVIQGETSLFQTFVAIKEASLSQEFVDKWTNILKGSKLKFE
ncbi:MAG: hypothetical protein ABI723_02775 [Bacteroidia bacterium]